MRIKDLGPVIIEHAGDQVDLGLTRQAALLARLAMNPGRAVSPEALAAAGWGPDADVSPASLHSQLWRLRNALAPDRGRSSSVLVRAEGGYRLAVKPDDVDSTRFERIAAEVTRSAHEDPTTTLAMINDALALWRGRPYEAFESDATAEAAAARLEEFRAQLEERRIDALSASGELEWAIADLEPLIARTPYRERLWVQRMTALARLGRTEEALDSYQRIRRQLDDELGLEPGRELKVLHARILAADPTLTQSTMRAGAARAAMTDGGTVLTGREVHLPRRRTALVGRDPDLARVVALISNSSLVTLTGAGGTGKTRLAVEVASSAAADFPDGIWFVDLTAVDEGRAVVDVVASTLALTPSRAADPARELVRFTSGRRMLIVLDNCEHVLDAAATCVDAVLSGGPGPVVLATSREPLELDDEIVWTLAPLALSATAGEESPAVRLFCQRARSVVPDLELDAEQVQLVREICRSLDGLPLALELAAARARSFDLTQIAEQVSADPSRLARLGRSHADHRENLFGTIEWSYRLLSEPEQALHRRLSMLPGQFSVSAARGVSPRDDADIPHRLAALAHRSLLVTSVDTRSRQSTFAQLNTVRAHARRKLHEQGQEAEVRELRDRWVADLLRRRPFPGRPDEGAWYDEVDGSYPAIRATLQGAVRPNPEPELIRLGSDLFFFWYYRSKMIEGRRWLEAVNEVVNWPDGAPETMMLRLRLAAAHLLVSRPDLARAHMLPYLERLDRVDDHDLLAVLERVLALITSSWAAGDAELFPLLLHPLHSLIRRIGTDEAALFEDLIGCLVEARSSQAGPSLLARTEDVFGRSVKIGNGYAQSLAASVIATLYTFAAGDPATGKLWIQRSVDLMVPLGDAGSGPHVEGLGDCAAMTGDFAAAARYFSSAQTYLRRADMRWVFTTVTEPLLEATRASLGLTAFDQAWAEGEHLTLGELARSWQS